MEKRIGVLRALVVLGALPLLAAGCSVPNPFAPAGASAKQASQEQALKWAQCMRQHGVDVSDPGANGSVRVQATPGGSGDSGGAATGSGGAVSGGGNGSGAGAPPEIQSAMDACKQYRPNGGQAAGPPSQAMIDAGARYAQCMRDHGIPIQDPTVSGSGVSIQASPGAFDPNSDQFKQAQQACQHYLDAVKPAGS